MVVLVTGASGQLGQALQSIGPEYKDITFYFASSREADITDISGLETIFSRIAPDYCINAAAYTAVDKAESDSENAYKVNVEGAANIAKVCNKYNTALIHVSTDFVFDGNKTTPYTEEDETNPQGVYGRTKREGEIEIKKNLREHYIVRTSWLYSQYGNNFMKTMLRLAAERESLGVVNDQTGTPTHAVDLARAIMTIITSRIKQYGVYHYSNEGETTWYGFADKIFEVNAIDIDLKPIPTEAYPTPAKRPAYSVLDKSKIKKVFGIEISNWEDRV
ncbi:MAG TPA: dTDP-4-dehydrorhamnose reductase [Flavobacterium sp.]|nr:dTDP-4-dehydrorhamnose reductase [Flavobacterium sp.]